MNLIRLHITTALDSAKRNLDSSLKNLVQDATRQRENLSSGGHLNTRLMMNRADIDVFSAEVNRLSEILSMMGDEEVAEVKTEKA